MESLHSYNHTTYHKSHGLAILGILLFVVVILYYGYIILYIIILFLFTLICTVRELCECFDALTFLKMICVSSGATQKTASLYCEVNRNDTYTLVHRPFITHSRTWHRHENNRKLTAGDDSWKMCASVRLRPDVSSSWCVMLLSRCSKCGPEMAHSVREMTT